ncbi:MAG: S8/S53 family peptidase [Candidatus Zixiibacteriota bacterium]
MPPKSRKAKPLVITTLALFLYFEAMAAELSPGLQKLVSSQNDYDSDSVVNVVVFLDDHNVKQAVRKVAADPFLTRDVRIKSVVGSLKSFQASASTRVKNFLETHSTGTIVQHWIVPAFTATIPLAEVESLAKLDGVKLVVENSPVAFEEPVDIKQAPTLSAGALPYGLRLMNVPYLWNRGFTGKGRLVCSFDTGVEQSHPALASKWRGNHTSLSAAWFSKVAGDTLPSDRTGHGTHTMGIMVGSTPLDTFGVAFEAEWITAGVIDQGRPLGTTISDILEAFEWSLDPDGNPNTTQDVPDVILNSWGIPEGLFAPCDETFYTAIDNVEAAGIVTIFAAGNEGPDPKSMRYPADRATTPLNSFAVGAIDSINLIGSFSSRGPSSCDPSEIKPEVVAPGVAIRSSYKGGGYMYVTGTSMAAPYIAGLAILMRQYNPDVTVDEIKNALIQSCTDLGPPGEDNTYGYGLPDASKLLDYLPPPVPPHFSIVRLVISDDGIALPGEKFELQLMLYKTEGNIESVNGTIVPLNNDSVTLVRDHATFFFGSGGTTALNSQPFQLIFDSTLSHGRQIPFLLLLESSQEVVWDTLEFTLTVGIAPKGSIASHITDQIAVTVSDFGQFGFAPGSIYNLRGEGFHYNVSQNLLYEAGILLGRNPLQFSSAVRDSLGKVTESDFVPVEDLSAGGIVDNGGFQRQAVLVDTQSEIPIPITVHQQTTSFPGVVDNGFLIVKYFLRNDTIEKLINLYFGLFADFDLMGGSEYCLYDETMNLLCQQSTEGPVVGLVGLENLPSFKVFANDTNKRGFNRTELFDIISSPGIDADPYQVGDMFFIASSGPFAIDPHDSVEVALALVAGHDVASIYANAIAAKEMYNLCTDIDDNDNQPLPLTFELHQNYPNPFNPTTNISFSLSTATDVSLEVFNILGQKVKILHTGRLPSGTHTFQWDATDDRHEKVASGIYFYRLTAGEHYQTKKMVLLK